MRSIHQLRNKKLKELQILMSRCKKGSRQWKKYNRAKRYVLSKSQSQLEDALHKTTKEFVDWCMQHDVKHVVLGNPEGVQRKTKKKKRKETNQKLSNWSFGKIHDLLTYKLKAKGIRLKRWMNPIRPRHALSAETAKKQKGETIHANADTRSIVIFMVQEIS